MDSSELTAPSGSGPANSITVPYGRPAAEALRTALTAAKAGEPLNPVTVVVASNHVGVATRRLLASGELGPICGRGNGLAAVTFVTVYRLAELNGAAVLAAQGRLPVSTPVLATAVRAALAVEPGMFAPVAQHPATEEALVASYRELRELDEAALAGLAAAGPRSGEVVRLFQDVRQRLVSDWYDEQDLLAAATSELLSGRAAESVIVYLPQLLSPGAAQLLRAAADPGHPIVIAGTCGDERADAEVALSLSRLGLEFDHSRAEKALTGPFLHASRTHILTASDSDDEIRAAVRAIVDAARAGTPLDRIAILHSGKEPHGRLAQDHLAAAGLPANGPSVLPLSARVAGRFLLGLLSLPAVGFGRAEVLGWMSDVRLRLPESSDGWAPLTRWERLSRRAGVVGGRADWDQRLARLAAEKHALASERADEQHPRYDPSYSQRAAADATEALRLREVMIELIHSLEAAASESRSWTEHVDWALDLVDRHLGSVVQRNEWPPAERKAAERIESALRRLAALDSVADCVSGVGLDVFSHTLELELANDLGRQGRFGEGVLVGPLSMGVGLDLDLLIVVGMAEGTLPRPVRDDSLLPDSDRESTAGQLPLRHSALHSQHRHLLAAIAGSERQLLTFPRGDLRRSVERVPSRWLLDVVSELAGERWWSAELAKAKAPWLTHVGSFNEGLLKLDFPATSQEHRLRALLAAEQPVRLMTTSQDAVLAGASTMADHRASPRFTRFDGNLAGVVAPSPVDFTASATGLERWARCPQAYLQNRILGVAEPENPEDELRITPRDRGSLVHSVLEKFIEQVLASDNSREVPDPATPWSANDRAALLEIAQDVFKEFEAKGLTGRAIFWRRDQFDLTKDLLDFLLADDMRRQAANSHPIAAEVTFGLKPDDVGPVTVQLPDGRSVQFKGAADRVDRSANGALQVIDYKTGGDSSYTQLSGEDPTMSATLLQLPIYGLAARLFADDQTAPVTASYWFVSKKGRFKDRGYQVTDEVIAELSRQLGRVVDGIESGLFPHHPSNDTKPWVDCVWCDPDGLGVGDLRRSWDLKRDDPAFAIYANVAEPLEPAEALGTAQS